VTSAITPKATVGRRLDTGIRRRAGSSDQALATEELSGDQDRCRQPVSRLAAAWPNLGPWCWNRPMTFGCRRSLPGQYVSVFVHCPTVIASRGSTPSPGPRSVAIPDQRSGVLGRTVVPQRSDVHLSTRQGEGGRHSGRQCTCRRFRADAFGIPRFSWLAPVPASRPCCRSQSTLRRHSHGE
jgi:hypothetical protein